MVSWIPAPRPRFNRNDLGAPTGRAEPKGDSARPVGGPTSLRLKRGRGAEFQLIMRRSQVFTVPKNRDGTIAEAFSVDSVKTWKRRPILEDTCSRHGFRSTARVVSPLPPWSRHQGVDPIRPPPKGRRMEQKWSQIIDSITAKWSFRWARQQVAWGVRS